MERLVQVGDRMVGEGMPVFIIGEIGNNHNGDMKIAKKIIDAAYVAGCDAVKFQKRTPELCVPMDQRTKMRETPWGYITYMEYRYKVEFEEEEYQEIDRYCKEKGMMWFATPFDVESVKFLEKFDMPLYKVGSALRTDTEVLNQIRKTGKPIIMSTGMSTMEEIEGTVKEIGVEDLIVLHCTSAYPCPPAELNLKMVDTLLKKFPCPIGYSGHETGLATTVAAVALGASAVERHITLDRSMWGSDQSASVEPVGLQRLVKDIRIVEEARGDGVKKVYESEAAQRERCRKVPSMETVKSGNGSPASK